MSAKVNKMCPFCIHDEHLPAVCQHDTYVKDWEPCKCNPTPVQIVQLLHRKEREVWDVHRAYHKVTGKWLSREDDEKLGVERFLMIEGATKIEELRRERDQFKKDAEYWREACMGNAPKQLKRLR